MKTTNRREFVLKTTISGVGIALTAQSLQANCLDKLPGGKRIGIIGLDTSHSVAFTKALNVPAADEIFQGYRIVAAYPYGSLDIVSSNERIPGYTVEVQKYGVEIVDSIAELLTRVDVVMLETNDGRLHLKQGLEVIEAGKSLFVDKPVAASLSDAIQLYEAAEKNRVPIFSSSSLRYITGMEDILAGKIGSVNGAFTYSPAKLEKTHPDLFWYGIHGVETLFAIMGIGCISVVRVSNEDADIVTGIWKDGRLGSFRGIRSGKGEYGGIVFGEKGILSLGGYAGYNPLLVQIIKFFAAGVAPVRPEETLEILAFMEAAELSKARNGASVDLNIVWKLAQDKV